MLKNTPYFSPRRDFWWLSLLLIALACKSAYAATPLEITLEGIGGEIHDTVLAQLSLERERGHPLLSEFRMERLHRRAPDEIRRALRPFGYYSAQVEPTLTKEGELWRATYRIDTGPPVRVASVHLEIEGPGADDEGMQAWREAFPLQRGDILLHQVYEGAKEDLLRIARERGFLEGELVMHEIRVSIDEASADIALRYASGPRYRFGTVQFSEVPLKQRFLERFATFRGGDYYDADKLYRLHRDLSNSDYFERVDVVPRTDVAEERRVPVEVGLSMRPRDRYTMGLGYGTDTGARATAGMERRWATNDGHRFGGNVVTSETLIGGRVHYRIPLDRPNTDALGFSGSRERERTETSIRDTSLASTSFSFLMGNDWLRTFALNYQEETFEVGELTDRATMFYPSLNFQRVVADDRLFTTHGWRLMAETRVADRDLYSATSLVQGRLSGKFVESFLGGRAIGRFDTAASYTTEFDKLPVSLRFFAGGDYSVRGYAYQSLGPRDANGEVEGGQHLLVWSAEYDRYFGKYWGAAVFTDWGNAFNSFGDYLLKRTAGTGVRWRLPFGIIRFDVAVALSEPDHPWRLHLSIGPDL